MHESCDPTFAALMPDSEAKVFRNARRTNRSVSQAEAREGLARLLTGEFLTEDGMLVSPKDLIDMKQVAYVMANPTPQNAKALYETAGLIAPKEVDVKSGGKSIDWLLSHMEVADADGKPAGDPDLLG